MSMMEETNNNKLPEDFDGSNDRRGTPIQEFYAEQKIFITGGTGFLGNLLIDKLLRSCPRIDTLFLLVRVKKDKKVQDRINELFQNVFFNRLKTEVPKFRDKIVILPGDCGLPNLGLSDVDREMVIRETTTVFHVAATVRFDEKLETAVAINVQSTNEIIEMCKEMQNLKACVYVSTAYSNCHLSEINECFYTYPVNYKDIINLVNALPPKTINEMSDKIIGKWPNTYTFTKALSEALIRDKNNGIPMGIFRPAIVTTTSDEPVSGWISNLYGPTGVVVATLSYFLRSLHCDKNVNANIIPGDSTINALIACAWDIYTETNRRNENMKIYNYVSCVEAPFTWSDYCTMHIRQSRKLLRYSSIFSPSIILIKNKSLYNISISILHLFPALVIDTVKVCTGQKPSFWQLYKKLHKFSGLLSYFSLRNWEFTNNNIQELWRKLNPKDQELFNFNMANFDWLIYSEKTLKGVFKYMQNENMNTLKTTQILEYRLYLVQCGIKYFLYLIGIWILWRLFT